MTALTAFYNDNDPFVIQWLAKLAEGGHVAPGKIDDRSIQELTAADVTGPGQRHLFAGIGGWSRACRLAGVADDASIWTGSCPCQPFSDAGSRSGTCDPRHLWPAWFKLICECRPAILFGEQVASRAGLAWLDLVRGDLEGCGYAFGASDLCAAGVGAPHIRQRLYFVASTTDREPGRLQPKKRQPRRADAQAERGGKAGRVADHPGERRRKGRQAPGRDRARSTDHRPHDQLADPIGQGLEILSEQPARPERPAPERGGEARSLGHARGDRDGEHPGELQGDEGQHDQRSPDGHHAPLTAGATRGRVADAGQDVRGPVAPRRPDRQDPTQRSEGAFHDQPCSGDNGDDWTPCDWLACSDGVARPVEPGTFPLVAGLPGRVGRLRGYGNSIVPQVAAAFIRAAMDAISDLASGKVGVHDASRGDQR